MAKINYEKKTYRYTNESFSGCDMTATISIKHLDKKTGREKYFHYNVGELQTISYSINMDKTPVRSIGNVNAKDYVPGQRTIAGSLVFNVFNRHFSKNIMKELNENYDGGTSYLVDEIPPFDVTLTAANEYGYRSKMCIFGIRLLNEGQVMSINDVYVENTYQFYATDVDYFDDEMKYSRNKKGMYYLKGNTIEWNEPKSNSVSPNDIIYNNNYVPDNKISLEVGIKQPAENRKNGLVDFYISPGVKDAVLSIKSSNGDNKKIVLKAKTVDETDSNNKWYKNNVISHKNLSLKPGVYDAIVTEKDGRKTNSVSFNVKAIAYEDKISKYKPIIKNITNTSFVVIPAALGHNAVKVSSGSTLSQSVIYDLKEQATIKDLKEGGVYTVATFDKDSKVQSPSKTFKLKSSKDTVYKRLKLYIESNSSKLVYTSDITEYVKILTISHNNSLKNGTSLYEELIKTKDKYKKQMDSANNETDRNKFKILMFMTGEILYFENKFMNRESKIINKESLEMPKYELDDAGNNVFHFNDNVEVAEFYKTTGKMNYFTDHVHKTVFRIINRVKNSFRFIGENGTNNYVETISKDLRSDSLYFYIMSDEEKEKYYAKKCEGYKISDREIDYIKNDIQTSMAVDITEKEKDIMSTIKILDRSEEFPLYAPIVYKEDEGIYVKSLMNDKSYIAIATIEEIINNEMFIRIPTENNEALIDFNSSLLMENETYIIWIEDSEFNKISDSFYFTYNDEDTIVEISEFVLDDFISEAEQALKDDSFRNNGILSSTSITNNILKSIKESMLSFEEAYKILKKMKHFLCIKGPIDKFCNLSIKDNDMYVDSEVDGYIYCYSIDNKIDIIKIIKGMNIMQLKQYDLIVITSNDLRKSNILYRNNKTMEEI